MLAVCSLALLFGGVCAADEVGAKLQGSFVWLQAPMTGESLHAGFRRKFALKAAPAPAQIQTADGIGRDMKNPAANAQRRASNANDPVQKHRDIRFG
jgi:hypothetical protein